MGSEILGEADKPPWRSAGPCRLKAQLSGSFPTHIMRAFPLNQEAYRAQSRGVPLFPGYLLPYDPGPHAPAFGLQQGFSVDTPKHI